MKSFFFTLVIVLLLGPVAVHAQLINDCSGAVVVCDNSDLEFNPIGPGHDDYADPDNDPGCIVALEQNSAWYYFQISPLAPPNLVLGFIISPNGGQGEDYDWALYGPNVNCGDLGTPVRCSSSSAQCGFCPETGMGMGTTDFTEGPGTGDGFVSTLVVQPGQGFYLMIDNWLGTNDGFVLSWTDSAADYLNCAAQPPCSLEALAGDDIEACVGDTDISLEGSAFGGHGNETYEWVGTNNGTDYLSDAAAANPEVNLPDGFFGSITYTLTVREDTCISMDVVELVVNQLPVVNITQIGPFCPDDPPHTLTALPPGGTWGGANTGSSFHPITNGTGIHTVTYTYTDANGCSNEDFIDIEVYEAPEVTIDPAPASFCDSEGSVLLTATGSEGAGGYMYNWTTPSGLQEGNTYDAELSGLYTVTVTDANGCINTTSTTVTAHPNPEVEIVDPGPLCESTEIMTLTSIPPGGEYSGSIVDPAGEIQPNQHPPGTYNVSYLYYDNNGCEGSDDITLTIIPVPEAIAGNNGPLCGGEQILLTGETTSTGSTIVYEWNGPNGYTSNVQNPTNATQGGTYVLQVIVDGCPSELVATTVQVSTTPDALAQNTGPYCGGESIQLLGSTTATGTVISYAWSGPGGYTSTVQNPTDATLQGMYSLIITVDGCPSAAATTQVVFSTPPNAMASNTGPYCQGESVSLLGSTTTPGTSITYSWSGPNGYTSNVQNPTDADTAGVYTLTINVDGCSSQNTSTTVVINSLPQPVISGPNSFCIGNTATLDAGAGYNAYQWNEGTITQTLVVNASGTYQVTVTDANMCTGTASISVSEIPSLTPVVTGTLEFCEGGSTTLDAGPGFVNYTWSTGDLTQTIVVTDGGNYGVLVEDAAGCTGSTNVTVTEHTNPTVTIGGSTTFCIGGSTTLDAGAGYTSYAWSTSSLTQTILVTSPGIYSVDVVDIYGCPGSGSVTVTESTSLSPVITGTPAFCENGTTTLNAGSGFATYDWSDGSMNQTLVVSTAGTYSVSVSDGQGCFGDTSVIVTEVLPPSAILQPTAELCNTTAGGSVINLYTLILSGDMSGTWEDADQSGAVGLFTNLNFNNVAAGNYSFIYTTNSATIPCPESEYEVIITVLDCTCPDVFFFNANPLCNTNDVLDLSTLENTSEPGNWMLSQTPPGSNPATLTGSVFDATGGDPGDYTMQFILQNQPPPGCPLDFDVIVHVDDDVHAGTPLQPVSYCANESVAVDLNALLTGEDQGGTWNETSGVPSQGGAFNAASGTFQTNNQLPGLYTFEYSLIAPGACPDDAATVSVEVVALPTVVVDDFVALDCANPVQSLNGEGSSNGPGYTIEWTGPGIILDGNENTLQPTIDQQGTYVLTVTEIQSGCSNSASVTVIANTDPPTGALINAQDPACFGDDNGVISIDQVFGGTAPYEYSLNGSAYTGNEVYPNLAAGNYTIDVQDVNGCRWDTAIVLLPPTEITINIGPDIELGLGETATIEALVSLAASELDTLIWSPDNAIECIDVSCLQANVIATNSVTLSATVYDIHGCSATDELLIYVNKERRVYIPTVFSPNGDGINDLFFVFGDEDQIVNIKKFVIYSRWGEMLHEATNFKPNDPNSAWDGLFNEEALNPGVFVYAAEVEFIDGITKLYTGDVTLVR
jgi:gliding motility-associated-like protein